jgi:hypothetical protein
VGDVGSTVTSGTRIHPQEKELNMAALGNYCKAYPLSRLSEFAGWAASADLSAIPAAEPEHDEEVEPDGEDAAERDETTGEDVEQAAAPQQEPEDEEVYLFVQEDYRVTGDIFLDEHVVFGAVTPEWIAFCKDDLKFDPNDADLPVDVA